MSRARKGRDGRTIPTVDASSEYVEVERRRYQERNRRERADNRDVEQALKEAAPRLERKGWKVTRKESER
jgi:hypothetical protein